MRTLMLVSLLWGATVFLAAGDKSDKAKPYAKAASIGEGELRGIANICCDNDNRLVALPDGRLMTAEKDTTRIKIYDSSGQRCEQVLQEVQELVAGCAYIPMAVDTEGNVYIANKIKGFVIKCSPQAE